MSRMNVNLAGVDFEKSGNDSVWNIWFRSGNTVNLWT